MACEVNNKEINSQCAELWYDPRTLLTISKITSLRYVFAQFTDNSVYFVLILMSDPNY